MEFNGEENTDPSLLEQQIMESQTSSGNQPLAEMMVTGGLVLRRTLHESDRLFALKRGLVRGAQRVHTTEGQRRTFR